MIEDPKILRPWTTDAEARALFELFKVELSLGALFTISVQLERYFHANTRQSNALLDEYMAYLRENSPEA